MLIETHIQLKNEVRPYIFNPENVMHIDEDGILFAPNVYRMFPAGEYDRLREQLVKLDMEDVLPKVHNAPPLDNV